MSRESGPANARPARARLAIRWALQTLSFFGIWFAVSGHTEVEFLLMGVAAAVAGTALTHWLFSGDQEPRFQHIPYEPRWFLHAFYRAALYLPWMHWEILISNLHVVRLVLHPRLPVSPSLVMFHTSLRSEAAQVLLAQSITLTPGTVTVDVSKGRFIVHCLSEKSREGIEEGSIQRKIAEMFGDDAPEKVSLVDVTSLEQVLP